MKLYFLRSVFVRGKHVDAGQVAEVSSDDCKILTSGNRPPCEAFNPEKPEHKRAEEKNNAAAKLNIQTK